MVALAGMRRGLHVAQQGVHLFGAHPATRTDRAVTGNAGQDRLDPGLHGLAAAQIREFVQDVADHRLGIDLAQNRRGFAHRDGPTAKGFNGQAQSGQVAGDLHQLCRFTGRQLHDFGDQQCLCGHPVFGHLAFQLFINQPFMRRVLIDDHHAGCGLCDDVILVDLTTRGTQRQGFGGRFIRLRILRHLDHPRAKAPVEFGKAGRLRHVGRCACA